MRSALSSEGSTAEGPIGWDVAVVGVVAVVAASSSLLLPNGSLNDYGFNGAVYLGSSVHLIHGVLPYRDFVLIQPPGISLLLSPLGALSLVTGTHAIWGLARVVMIAMTTLNCVLVALLLRRFGPAGTLTGGLFLATFSVAGLVNTQVKLEPFLIAFVLMSALALFGEARLAIGRRATVAGALLGFAGLIKIWAIFPAVVMIAIILSRKRTSIVRFSVGLVAGFVVPALPFFVASPVGFVHDVLLTQMRRAPSSGQALGVAHRLATLSFVAFRPFTPTLSSAAVLGALVVSLIALSVVHRWNSLIPIEWFAVGSSVISVAALALAPEYFAYYAYFPAAFFALVVGSTVSAGTRSFRLLAGGGGRRSSGVVTSISAGAILALTATFLIAQISTTRSALATLRPPGPSKLISSMVPAGACVVSNDAYTTLMADRLSSSRPGCPTVVDAEGLWLSIAPTSPPPFGHAAVPRVTTAWRTILASADYVVLNRLGDAYVPWTPHLRSWFAQRFELLGSAQNLEVYRSVMLSRGRHGPRTLQDGRSESALIRVDVTDRGEFHAQSAIAPQWIWSK